MASHPTHPGGRREAREAFLRGEATTPLKHDAAGIRPSAEKLDREKSDKERPLYHTRSDDRPVAPSKPKPTSQQLKEIEGYVGFANLPDQVYRKSVKRGFDFTLMVVGESGLGKSTLINSMFLTDIYNAENPGPSHRLKKTTQVDSSKVVLKENGVQLRLTVVDTPGFGDAVDNSNCWQPVTEHIEFQYESYLNAESRVSRTTMNDSRVHCCLYFISPNGHGLKPLDIEFMKKLHDKVNIIPVISKADTMTVDECRDFKKTVMNEIVKQKIKIYEFPDCDDEEEQKVTKALKERVPFAVVGSNTVVDCGGKKVRGRVYPWGVVEVENLEHNDFLALRNMLIRTHMQDLKDVTNNVHYENFRYGKLATVSDDNSSTSGKPGAKTAGTGKSPLLQMEEEKKDHVMKMKKMEAEMEQVFELKVKEKKQKLKDSEIDLQRRSEQMKQNLEQQQQELEEKHAAFQREMSGWEEQQRLDDQRRTLDAREGNKKDKKKLLFN